MAEVKDKLVTVESIGALHEYNMERVIDVAHGGTGAINAEQALVNLGAAPSHRIGREVEGQQSFVESSAVNMLVDLVPYVSIAAKDTTSDSAGAKIQVSDHTNENLGEAGLIQMKAQKIEIDADVIKGDFNFSGNVSGNVNLSGDMNAASLKTSGNIVVGGTAEFNDTIHIQDSGIYVCNDNIKIDNSHVFGLVDVVDDNGKVTDTNLEIGRDGKVNKSFDTYLSGNEVGIRSNGKLYITTSNTGGSPRAYGQNKLLWPLTGTKGEKDKARWMGVDETKSKDSDGNYPPVSVDLKESVSAQPHGIVLVFSAYTYLDNDPHAYPKEANVKDENWHSFFIPKEHINQWNGYGNCFTMFRGTGTADGMKIYTKLLFIHNDKIVGHANNMEMDAKILGSPINNRLFVLREVWGV